MGLMDELRKLTQPYGDDEDFYEGADSSFQPSYSQEQADASLQFENTFGDEIYDEPEPEAAPAPPKKPRQPGGGLFGGFSAAQQSQKPAQKSSRPGRKSSGFGGSEAQVVLFNPKNFDEAGELVTYLNQGISLVMALEGLPSDTARRLLDFISGIAFALNGKITPVSAKTYFVTPENVDLLDAQNAQAGYSEYEDDSDF